MTCRRIRGKELMTNFRLGPHASHRRGAQDGEGRSVSAPLLVVGLERYPTASIYSYKGVGGNPRGNSASWNSFQCQ